ncbi:MAG: energy transducer TonB [Verrucomicrobia bacterium]|nr:energy transducer TonB [Verrucomicrobiota bacterium]
MSHVKTSLLKVLSLSLLLGSFASLQAATSEGTAFDVRPTPVKTPPPEYPTQMKRDGVSGVVAIKVEIDESGAVTACSVTKSSNAAFEQPALNAVKNWRFTPAQKSGAPVKVSVVIPIKFAADE